MGGNPVRQLMSVLCLFSHWCYSPWALISTETWPKDRKREKVVNRQSIQGFESKVEIQFQRVTGLKPIRLLGAFLSHRTQGPTDSLAGK